MPRTPTPWSGPRSSGSAGSTSPTSTLRTLPNQYGSNYHLLNTIARWDRPPAPLDLDDRGRLRARVGIRPDWRRTSSAYCSPRRAEAALEDLIRAVPARFILLSYSSDGIVSAERLLELCRTRGAVRLLGRENATYRGGKQSSLRSGHNLELVALVDTDRRSGAADRLAAATALEPRRVALLVAGRFCRGRLAEAALPHSGDGCYRLPAAGAEVAVRLGGDGRIDALHLAGLALPALGALRSLLEGCVCRDAEEELAELEHAARDRAAAPARLGRELTRVLRRLAHRKWRASFEAWLPRLRGLAGDPALGLGGLAERLDGLEAAARRRFAG